MMHRTERQRCKPLTPLTLGLILGLADFGGAAVAQPAAEIARDGLESRTPRNGFGINLKPSSKRPGAKTVALYQPIGAADEAAQGAEIEMFVGESRVFPTPGVARIAVGNGQIVSAAALDNKEVILFANGVGTSSLFVWHEDGRYQRVKIHIVPGDTSRFAREIAGFLKTIPNTSASIIGDKVIVEGDHLSDRDIAKIDELAKRYPQIVNFTNRLGWEQMVLMDVKVVEFPTNELRELGLKWSAAGGAAVGAIWGPVRRGGDGYQINIQTGQNNPIPITNPDGTSNGIRIPSGLNVLSFLDLGLNAQLNLLAQDGRASILAEPQLSARNGAKATFLAGGEYPYTVSTINGPTVLFKPYGVRLDIVPRVDRNGVVRAVIESEVSAIDPSVSTPAGPGLSTRKTNTEFNVKSGETLVLSGLLSRKTSTNIDKVPLLGDLPVLGALFRSRRFQNDETELVVFVTPTVVDSRSPGLVDRVERTTERLRHEMGKEPYLTKPLQPGHDPARTNEAPPAAEPDRSSSMQPAAEPDRLLGRQPSAEPPRLLAGRPASEPDRPLAIQPAGGPSAAIPPAAERRAAGGSRLHVKFDGVVLRAEPSHRSRALLALAHGSTVQMGDRDPEPPGVGHWRHVVVDDLQGWVDSDWVEPLRSAVR